jgi:hypothetical protein
MESLSHYHCSSEWHFARLKRKGRGPNYAALIYSFALHLSKKSGVFYASTPRLAEYFGADVRSIRKALRQLVILGFFEKISEEPGATISYRPIHHKAWAANHTGQCTEKASTPWDEEPGDTLGRELHAISGGRFYPRPNFVKAMRNTGHSEADIREHFRTFVLNAQPVGKSGAVGLSGRFIKHLRNEQISTSTPLPIM